MLKPNQLRKTLTDSLPLLQRNSKSLNVLIDSGRILSTLATLLSLEYLYRLNMVIIDYTGNIDLLIVPQLEWLRVNEPDIMAMKDKQQNGFTFKADVISERVIVKQVGDSLYVDHVGENARPLQLYVHGALISEWQQ